ncbi:MAG: hypothetical protein HY329_16985 [Chloroflexi bacterium]|nr:hypothetical protein [Chloroflexota bacterium]
MPQPSSRPDLQAVCRRLLELTQAQSAAIELDDFAGFDKLTDERARLQRLLERTAPGRIRRAELTLLREAAELDRRNCALVGRLLYETGRALDQIHQGKQALHGYGRPGAHLTGSTYGLDTTG